MENQILTAIYGVDMKARNAKRLGDLISKKYDSKGKIADNKVRNEMRTLLGNDFVDGFEGEEDTGVMRHRALKAVNTFKTIKRAIW